MADDTFVTCPRCSGTMKPCAMTVGLDVMFWCEDDGTLVKVNNITGKVLTIAVPKNLVEAFGKIQEDKDALLIKQAAALDEIAELLETYIDYTETELLLFLKKAIRKTGRNILDVD